MDESMRTTLEEADQGTRLGRISTRIVGLHKQYYGKGPTKARTYHSGDLVVCLLRGGFNRVEETLRQEGRGQSVIDQRREFQEAMAERFKAVVEEEMGRPVIGFISGSQQNPDLLAELFVLSPSPELFEAHELEAAHRPDAGAGPQPNGAQM